MSVIDVDEDRAELTRAFDPLIDRALTVESEREESWLTVANFLVAQRKLCPPNYKFLVKRVKDRLYAFSRVRAAKMFYEIKGRAPSDAELEHATTEDVRSRWHKPRILINGEYSDPRRPYGDGNLFLSGMQVGLLLWAGKSTRSGSQQLVRETLTRMKRSCAVMRLSRAQIQNLLQLALGRALGAFLPPRRRQSTLCPIKAARAIVNDNVG